MNLSFLYRKAVLVKEYFDFLRNYFGITIQGLFQVMVRGVILGLQLFDDMLTKKERFPPLLFCITFYHSKKYAKDAPVLLAFAE